MRKAFEAGQLSEAQAAEIASAVEKAPSKQKRLVRMATWASREECGRIRAAADPNPKATRDRIHAGRHYRSRTDSGGAVRFGGACTPDQYAPMDAALQAECDRLFRRARLQGRREPREAYLMDALANLVTRDGGGDARPVGRDLSGELCEIEGIGPVPVEIAADLSANPFVKAVIRHGNLITEDPLFEDTG